MRELYIYYRIRTQDADAAGQAVAAFQSTLRSRHASLEARLLRGSDPTHESPTFMETYAIDPHRASSLEGVTTDIQHEIEALAAVLAPMLDTPRHTEAFIACAS